MVAKTIGTKVSFAWETTPNERPTTGYTIWKECTAHPDLNPAREQIETTTMLQENNLTYEDGLRDFGDLGFGSNLTDDVIDLFVGENGYVTKYPEKQAQGLNLWVCIDIKALSKSYYIPVKPQDFGLPSGEAGSNKYELTIYFSAVGDSGWYSDPEYAGTDTYAITISGYVETGVKIDIMSGDRIKNSIVTSSSSTIINLPNGNYCVIARKEGGTSQIKDLVVSGSSTTVTFTSFS